MSILSRTIIEYVKDKHPECNIDLYYEIDSIKITTTPRHCIILIDIPKNIISSYSVFSGALTTISTNYTENTILPQITSTINKASKL